MKTTILKRIFFCLMAIVTFMFVASAQNDSQSNYAEIQKIISKYNGEWNDSSYPGLITNRVPNTALMGNGDIGVASGGDENSKTFYISKGDFWTYRSSPVPVGGITLSEANPKTEDPDPMRSSLAFNASFIASGQAENFTPDRMLNGNWAAGYEGWVTAVNTNAATNPWWVNVDLGSSKTFNRIVVRHDAAARPNEVANITKNFNIYIRNNTSDNWEKVLGVEGNNQPISDIILDNEVTGRYVRLEVTKGTQETTDDSRTNPRARIGQFELYLNTDLAADATIRIENSTVVYDMGSALTISRYRIQMKTAQQIVVESSTDGTNWSPIGTHTGNAAIDCSIPAFGARYIRLTPANGTDVVNKLAVYSQAGLNLEEILVPTSGISLHEVQDILNAEVRTELNVYDTKLEMRTFTAATDNIIVTEITSKSEKAVDLLATLWAKADNASFPYTAAFNANYVTVSRTTPNSYSSDAKSYKSKAAMTAKVIGADFITALGNGNGKADMRFTIEPNQTVYLVTTVGGGGKTFDYRGNLLTEEPTEQAADKLSTFTEETSVHNLLNAHREWWRNYWSTSYVMLDTSDVKLKTLMKFYYAAQYSLGCNIRENKVAPGIYGLWHTTDNPSWNSDFHLNYNFISTFYGVSSSNRVEQNLPAIDAILQYAEQGKKNAGSTLELRKIKSDFVNTKVAKGDIDPVNGIPDAVLYPVGIGPWGSTIDGGYHNEALNASYSAFPMIEYYNYTQDEEFLRNSMYNYLKSCVNFYDAWLEKEDGKYQLYVGYNEGSWSINPAVELSVLKNVLDNLIKASETLGLDADKRPHWQDIRDNIAPQPTALYQSTKVYTLAEKEWINNVWSPMSNPVPGDGNIIPMESVIPGEQLGYYSTPEELTIAKNTIDIFSARGAWSQINNFPKIYPVAVNTRYPAQTIINNLVSTINSQMKKNLMIDDNVHGVEKAGSIRAINNMMLLSDQGIIKVFPNWISNRNAKFAHLREKGAFVISSEFSANTNEILYVDLVSEAGKTVTIASPWVEGVNIIDSNNFVIPTQQGSAPNYPDEITFSFETQVGMNYHIVKSDGSNIGLPPNSANVNIYPNPTSPGSTVYLETEFFDGATIEVYEIAGKMVQRIPVEGRITPVKIEVASGIYMFSVKAKDGAKQVIKVVVN